MFRLRRLRRVLIATASALVVAVLLCAAWLSTNWDMRRVERRARAAQLPWTQTEIKKTTYSAADLDLLRRADAAQRVIGRIDVEPHIAFRETVRRVYEQHAADLAAIENAVDQLSGQPVALDHEDREALGLDTWVFENIAWYLGLRIRICDASELEAHIDRLARFIPCSWPQLQRDSCLEQLIRGIAFRANDLRGNAAVAASLSRTLDRLAADLADEFKERLAHDADSLADSWYPDAWFTSTHATTNWTDRYSLNRKVIARFEREGYLDQLITIADVFAHHDRNEWVVLLPWSRQKPGWNLVSQWAFVMRGWAWRPAANQLTGKVLLAYLNSEPWPADPFRPGAFFKPIMRDATLIGAYAVGRDGQDDGGKPMEDFCVEIGPHRLGYPLASNPMPDPSY